MKSGSADLPLHYGRVPAWLSDRMTRLGTEISKAIIWEFGSAELLTRLSDPFWFQAFGAVLGMDWHSSGITTAVMGALKRGLNPLADDLGVFVCGGRGKYSRRTPDELLQVAARRSLDGQGLVRASRLSAKVDNTCIQDGFSIYLHSFVVNEAGQWAVVQQGMNPGNRMARRYHWHSPTVRSFILDPQKAIVGANVGLLTNLSDARAEQAQNRITDFLREHPDRQLDELRQLTTVAEPTANPHRHLNLPAHHEVQPINVNSKRLGAVLTLAYEHQYRDFAQVLLLKGLGPRTLQTLALVSEIIYGTPTRFDDPARFSFALGGKDGHPFPVPLKTYDRSIRLLERAVRKAAIGRSEQLRGLRTISGLLQAIERRADPQADVSAVIDYERKVSHRYGGRTVTGPAKPKAEPSVESPETVPPKSSPKQMELFS